jgi:2-polyprenyl-3-methyl-5-hydroxy-6-metoxy-1,4-benzoquinol methylase
LVRAERVEAGTLAAVALETSAEMRREMAVPSYTHANPVIRRLFWGRLDTAVSLASPARGETILDFGLGTGILLPTHHRTGGRVIGVDIDLGPARAVARRLNLETELVPAQDFGDWCASHPASVDVIYALDCLEHVEADELSQLTLWFASILRPAGRLVVSGPTETLAYRLGRFVAGFKNEYHHRNIRTIDAELRRTWRREELVRLPPLPLPTAFWILRYSRAS